MNLKTDHKVDDVYGITRELPLNYVIRKGVDDEFIESLARDRHIVIYGSSKQGKTSLRKKHLDDDDYILISCQSRWTTEALNQSILKQAGFEVHIGTERAISGTHKITVSVGAEGKIPFVAKANAKTDYSFEDKGDVAKFQPLALDPLDVNDLIKALNGINFNKFIILEDFHYLPQETQRDFSFTLKSFHENSKFVFIVIGVWREENRLIGFNGDLTDRVQSINADEWSQDQLEEVVKLGSDLLNIKFNESFSDRIIDKSLQTVHIVQEACRSACLNEGVYRTIQGDSLKILADGGKGDEIVQKIIDGQSGRYYGALQNIADGFQETDLDIPKWIVYAMLCFDDDVTEKGIRLRSLSRVMKAKHERGGELNNGSITQTLKAIGSLQSNKGVRPPILDYDTTNRILAVVDRGFMVWLKSQDRNQIAQDMDMPSILGADELKEAIKSDE